MGTALTSCSYLNPGSENNNTQYVSFDLDSIRTRGKLIAVTDFNSTNYFIYKGEPMGFNYELLKSFSDNIGIDLEIITENQLDNAFELLNTGKADLVAIGLTVNSSRKEDILFTEPLDETRQVLVQRKPRNWRSLTADAVNKKLIRNQLDLARKTIYVQTGSSHVERLVSLASELGSTIQYVTRILHWLMQHIIVILMLPHLLVSLRILPGEYERRTLINCCMS